MQRRTGLVSICFILVLLAVFPSPLRADQAAISCFVTNDATHVLVYAQVTNCFTKDMEAAILAGVPTTFTFLIDLYQERRNWLDKRITRLTVRHTIKYDMVKKLFFVSSDGEKEPAMFQDYASAKLAMADINGLPLVPIKLLQRNEYYYVQIKAKLEKVRLPLNMEYVFFFVSLWDFETDWYREGFFY
jgi:Domain of unknown function (DUF4390)